MLSVESSKAWCFGEIWISSIPGCIQGQELFATQSNTVEKLELWEKFWFQTLKYMENILEADNLILISAGNRVWFMDVLLTEARDAKVQETPREAGST